MLSGIEIFNVFVSGHLKVVLIAQKSKRKANNSGGKTNIRDYFGSKYKKESELCIQNLS